MNRQSDKQPNPTKGKTTEIGDAYGGIRGLGGKILSLTAGPTRCQVTFTRPKMLLARQMATTWQRLSLKGDRMKPAHPKMTLTFRALGKGAGKQKSQDKKPNN